MVKLLDKLDEEFVELHSACVNYLSLGEDNCTKEEQLMLENVVEEWVDVDIIMEKLEYEEEDVSSNGFYSDTFALARDIILQNLTVGLEKFAEQVKGYKIARTTFRDEVGYYE